jgi:MGT family glycosyltransferase
MSHPFKIKFVCFIPDNIVVKNYLPQLEILSKSSVFITHGGMNSINESLYYGVPMILFPQMHEQRINALRVQELKAGICVTKNEFIMSEMEHFFSAIVSDNSYRQHANKIGETLRSAGGSQKAVELINTYISK